ncbi:hypothetical protein DFH29DRAFT_877802 [Suillus ampliporus]|nr:hypothetical protein DFH29DRAFT_877802 [Suillus ampliporus]
MATPSSPSSAITAPLDYHETAVTFAKLAMEAMTCHSALLHYDSTSKSMTEWCWPDDDQGQKVPLLNFKKYRDERKFRYPCCLCASSSEREAYTEAAVYPWRDKATNKTYWNARCAYDRFTFNYPLRAYRKAIVLLTDCPEEHDKLCSIQLEWTWREQTELMVKLDSSIGDGIMRAEFCILFKCCKRCKRVGIRQTMNRHILVCSEGVQKQQPKWESLLVKQNCVKDIWAKAGVGDGYHSVGGYLSGSFFYRGQLHMMDRTSYIVGLSSELFVIILVVHAIRILFVLCHSSIVTGLNVFPTVVHARLDCTHGSPRGRGRGQGTHVYKVAQYCCLLSLQSQASLLNTGFPDKTDNQPFED